MQLLGSMKFLKVLNYTFQSSSSQTHAWVDIDDDDDDDLNGDIGNLQIRGDFKLPICFELRINHPLVILHQAKCSKVQVEQSSERSLVAVVKKNNSKNIPSFPVFDHVMPKQGANSSSESVLLMEHFLLLLQFHLQGLDYIVTMLFFQHL